jgi:hypothetical protein
MQSLHEELTEIAGDQPQHLVEPGRSVRDEWSVLWRKSGTEEVSRLQVEKEDEMRVVAEALVAFGAASWAMGEQLRTETISEWPDTETERETTTVTRIPTEWSVREIEASEVPSPAGES